MTTTAQPVDVNQAFTAEKFTQAAHIDAINQSITERNANREADHAARLATYQARVANGEMRDLGGNRFEVLTGYDAGETFTVRMAAEGQLLEVVAEHGLDMTTGQAALYTSTPAWHELGNVIPGGTTDVEKVLELGGIDFEVVRRPVEFRNDIAGSHRMLPEHFVNVRQDTGAGLGVVGNKYTVLQNHQAFGFLQDLVDLDDVIWESAGAVRDGRRVFVSMRLPNTVTIDAEGIKDEIIPFIVAINSHDGSSLFQVVVTPWRPVCSNTERFALRDAHAKWGVRHTLNARDRIEEARRTLGLSVKYFDEFVKEEESLAQTAVSIADFEKVIDQVWGAPELGDSKRANTIHTNRVNDLTGRYSANAELLGRTAYAAERAITEYLDHGRDIRPRGDLKGKFAAARATRLMEGSDDETKTRAHRQLMTLVRR